VESDDGGILRDAREEVKLTYDGANAEWLTRGRKITCGKKARPARTSNEIVGQRQKSMHGLGRLNQKERISIQALRKPWSIFA